jgi:hypothetical protein
LDDTSPTSSATGDLDKWEASWWREISTIDGDDVSDFERLSEIDGYDVESHNESSYVAIQVACDLVEQHLLSLSTADDSKRINVLLGRLLTAAQAHNPLHAVGVADELDVGSSSSSVAAVCDADEYHSQHHRASTDEHLLKIQLEKLGRDLDCLRDQLKDMEVLRKYMDEIQAKCDRLQEHNTKLNQALSGVKADSMSVQLGCADTSCADAAPCNSTGNGEECNKTTTATAANKGKREGPVDETAACPYEGKNNGKGKGKGSSPALVANGADAKGKGKGKGKKVEPTKPRVELSCEVKSLPWKRWLIGAELVAGETVWDRVGEEYTEYLAGLVPRQEIEQRFAKTAGLQKAEAVLEEAVSAKPVNAKLASIAQDRLTREVAMKTLPAHLDTPQKAILVIRSLDSELLSVETATALRRCLCPSAEQQQELQAQREAGEAEYEQKLEAWKADGAEGKEPCPFQWDRLEAYLEGLAALPAVETRLSSWAFLSTLHEQVQHLQKGLQAFESMVRCFGESTELPFFLALILAFGNTLNGGKNQHRLGQADGFPVDVLGRPGGLDVVNDGKGKNVRQLMFETYFSKTPERAERLLKELAPLFALVQRSFGKTEEFVPVPIFKKEVRIQLEEFDTSIEQLRGDFAKQQADLQCALQNIEDLEDKFVIQIPAAFERAHVNLEELAVKRDDVRRQFKELLKSFRAETYRGDPVLVEGRLEDGNPKEEMTSSVWCLLWEDFFVRGSLIMEQTEKVQKDIFGPRFCGSDQISVESLEMLWQLKQPDSLAKVAMKKQRRLMRTSTK